MNCWSRSWLIALPSFSRSKVGQDRVQQFELDTLGDVGRQGLGVQVDHLVVGRAFGDVQEAQAFGTQGVHQQAGGHERVVRLTLDQGTGGHHQGGVDVGQGHAVVQVLQGFALDQVAVDFFQAFARFGDDGVQATHVQRRKAAIGAGDADRRVSVDRFFGRGVGGAFFRTTVTVDHVVASHFLLAGTHQGQFDLVLDFFDVDGAARRHATLEGRGDLFGQAGHGVVDSRRSGSGAAFNCEKRFGDGDGDLVIGVRNDSAVTLDHAQLARRGGGQIRIRISGLRQGALRVLASCVGLHGGVSTFSMFVWAPSRCPPFCPEALQPTGVGHNNFGTVGRRLMRPLPCRSLWSRAWARNRIPFGVTVMTATPVPFSPFRPEKTVAIRTCGLVFENTFGSTVKRQ